MLFELFATVVSGFAAAGIVLILRRLTGERLPKWLMPAAAGSAMLAFTIWSEYSWFARTSALLPAGFVLVSQTENSAPWRPWTYIKPMTDRFAAVDTSSIRTNDAVPDMRLVETYYWGRWAPLNRLTVVVDCAGLRRAPIIEGVSLADDGAILGAEWIGVPTDDPTLIAVCGGR
jgi:hypothetical protein